MKILFRILSIAIVTAFSFTVNAQDIKVLIVDGQNNHNWAAMTPFMKKQLEQTGHYKVSISTAPARFRAPRNLPKEKRAAAEKAGRELTAKDWAKWRPTFADFNIVISNYNGEDWPKQVKTAFEKYIRTGGRFICIHAANNSFPNWLEYNKMIGLGGWGGRTEKHGPYVYYNESNQLVRNTDKGRGGSHGPQHEFIIQIRNSKHPITAGMPTKWKHAKDELYDSLRGPGTNMEILATAWSPKSKRHEPMMMVLEYGKGKIFHTPMGHENGQSLQCIGFITTLDRACEWLATGKVTTKIPPNFPTANKVSMVTKK